MAFQDPADSPRASVPPDFALLDARELLASAIHRFPGQLPIARQAFESSVLLVCGEAVAVALAEAGESQRSAHDLLPSLIGLVSKFQNPWLAFRCIPIVIGSADADKDQTELAAEFAVTKGCVSDICVRLSDQLGLPPGRGMKSRPARKSYAARQTGKRARPLPAPWPHRGLFAT
jgi:hypothetical protein